MLEFGASILDGEWPNLPWSHWASYWMARRRPRIYDARCDRAGGLRVASTPRLPHLLHRSRVKNVAIGVSGMMARRDSAAPVNHPDVSATSLSAQRDGRVVLNSLLI